jgi:hypothetical protein
MESYQDLSSYSLLQQLLEDLENFVTIESNRNGNPWITVSKLSELFYGKYKVSLEEMVKVQGHNDSLRSLFISSRRFSIYGTPIPQEFYVALFQAAVPGSYHSQARAEGSEELPSRQAQRILEYRPILVPEIKSVNDLEIALMEIIKSLMVNHPKQFVTIAVLSRKFRDYYGQPIRPVMRGVCPDMKLIDLLQTILSIHVREVDSDWQITLKAHSVN